MTDNSLQGLLERIAAHALALRILTFGIFTSSSAIAGGLVSYGLDPKEAFAGVARLLKEILAGASAAGLPVGQPTKYILAVNLKTAKTLGIAVPAALLARADGVIG